MTRFSLAAAFVVILALPGFGYIYHVYYDDSIQDGIDSVSPGDTVLVHPGTYYEDITLAHRVNVWSTNGSGSTTIDGGNADQTVDSNGADSLRFGGLGAGFTIDGGIYVGVRFSGSNAVHVEDLVIESDPAVTGMEISSCATTTDFEEIRIGPITDPIFGGLYIGSYHGSLEDITVHKTGEVGVWVEGCSPDFTDLQIDTCDVGLWGA